LGAPCSATYAGDAATTIGTSSLTRTTIMSRALSWPCSRIESIFDNVDVRIVHGKIEADLRMFCEKTGNHRRKDKACSRRWKREPDGSGGSGAEIVHHVKSGLITVEHWPEVLQKALASLGRGNRTCRSLNEAHTQAFLNVTDQLTLAGPQTARIHNGEARSVDRVGYPAKQAADLGVRQRMGQAFLFRLANLFLENSTQSRLSVSR
jgi:hypothetical protein